MKNLILLFAFSFAPILSFATKTEKVVNYLGYDVFAKGKPVGEVSFVFRGGVTLRRTGDGKKTWETLLTSVQGYDDSDDCGPLMAIQIKNGLKTTTLPDRLKKVDQPKEKEATDINIRPRAQKAYMNADSAETADRIRDAINEGSEKGKTLSAYLYDLFVSLFNGFEMAIWYLLAVLILLQKSSANETVISFKGSAIYGRYFKDAFEILSFLLYIVLAVYFSGKLGVWFFETCIKIDSKIVRLAALVAMTAVGVKVINWLISNPKVSGAKQHYHNRGGNYPEPQ